MVDPASREHRDWIAAVLRAHEGPLLRYALRLAGNVETARDLVQETFLRFCAQPREALEDRAAPWLYRVCRQRALDHWRKEHRMHSLTSSLGAAEPAAGELDDGAACGDELARAQALVARLPPDQQEVVRLRFQSGLSYRQIAEATGHTPGNVGYLLHVALRALRRQMQLDPAAEPSRGGK